MNQTGYWSVQRVWRYIRAGSLFRENSARELDAKRLELRAAFAGKLATLLR
jgi:hypothetical protein